METTETTSIFRQRLSIDIHRLFGFWDILRLHRPVWYHIQRVHRQGTADNRGLTSSPDFQGLSRLWRGTLQWLIVTTLKAQLPGNEVKQKEWLQEWQLGEIYSQHRVDQIRWWRNCRAAFIYRKILLNCRILLDMCLFVIIISIIIYIYIIQIVIRISSYIIYLYMIHDFLRLQWTTLWAEQPRNESAPSCKQSWFGSHCRSRSGWGCLADMKINCYHKRMASIFCLHWIRTVGQPYYGATWLLRRISGNHGICVNFQKLPALLCKIWHLSSIFPLPWCDHQLLSPVAFVAKGASVLGHSWALTSICLHFDAKGWIRPICNMNR